VSHMPHQLNGSDATVPHPVDAGALGTMIGASPAIRAVRDQIERLLPPGTFTPSLAGPTRGGLKSLAEYGYGHRVSPA
jgi:hypothetical protein